MFSMQDASAIPNAINAAPISVVSRIVMKKPGDIHDTGSKRGTGMRMNNPCMTVVVPQRVRNKYILR
jgi:hypothetical protein